MRLEVLLYSQLALTHVDGLPIRARFFWQKRKGFDGIADDIRDYHSNESVLLFSHPPLSVTVEGNLY